MKKGEVKTFNELVERVREEAIGNVRQGVREEALRSTKEVLGKFVEVEGKED